MNIISLYQKVPPNNSSIKEDNDLREINLEGIVLVPYEKSFSYNKEKLVPSSLLDHILENPGDLPLHWKVNPDGYDFMRIVFRGTTLYYASLQIFFYHNCLSIDLKSGILEKSCLHLGASSWEYGYVPVLNN